MEKVQLQVTGMDCTNCALTINKYLTKKGLENVKVNFVSGLVTYDYHPTISESVIQEGIHSLGYNVVGNTTIPTKTQIIWLSNHWQRFLFCALFSLPLMLHMVPGLHVHWLMNPLVQLAFTLPVYIVGMQVFGKSAFNSVMKGIPNMNVLITLGATAALAYSLYGTITQQAAHFLFYETTATIITLVFFGNWLEERSLQLTQKALQKLIVEQKVMANMIAYDDKHEEHIFPVESSALRVGDLILIKDGEHVPMDCKILWGEVGVNEAIVTGESAPVFKKMNDMLIGGSIINNGSVKAYVTAIGQDAVLGNILKLVQDAQSEKPPIQQLADKISVIFVPLVSSIALLCFCSNWLFLHHTVTESLLRSIAVLVIACPCAMGLATPAAIAVGLGRAAGKGILFKNATSLETFSHIKAVVFDKTGTLTTGNFTINHFTSLELSDADFQQLVFSIEKFSNHPIALCLAKNWKTKAAIRWSKIEEKKGLGMQATDQNGNVYWAGSYQVAKHLTNDAAHNVYITKNNVLLGWIDVSDEIRSEAKQVIQWLQQQQIDTILLSGDTQIKSEQVAATLGIQKVVAQQTPEQKLAFITHLTQQMSTAMVGDGINDAPALAKASVGIALSDASNIAMQSAQVVLMNQGLQQLPLALSLGKHTYKTIQENLFWAFAYNIIAIPVAAFGYLNPSIGALLMGFSDVVLAINSVRLRWKKVL